MKSERFIFIQLRGGMDGLTAIQPPEIAELKNYREDLMVDGYLAVENGFAFHPALKTCHDLYQRGELAFIHACGLPIRTRSHFRSQDFLETGKLNPMARAGWLAEIIEAHSSDFEAIVFGSQIPLVLQGTNRCFNWTASEVDEADEYLISVMKRDLYKQDADLAEVMSRVARIEELTDGYARQKTKSDPFETIGSMMSKRHSPNIGVINLGGWDTHHNQIARLARGFSRLDKGLAVLRENLSNVWNDTVIVVASEFGRSIRQNGTHGTDHGTGGLCLVMGGAVEGGQRYGDWPGLTADALFEGRDLYPANDIRGVFANIAQHHMGCDPEFITDHLFPNLPPINSGQSILRKFRKELNFV